MVLEAQHTNHKWFAQLGLGRDGDERWVRILRLRPGIFGAAIHCDLTLEEVGKTEPFDALSYCCGPQILSRAITVNGRAGFCITENLWNALQRIRRPDVDRRLWVDAVCIDQENDREKSSQIRHLHVVYSRAKEVCIYFGECSQHTMYDGKCLEHTEGSEGVRLNLEHDLQQALLYWEYAAESWAHSRRDLAWSTPKLPRTMFDELRFAKAVETDLSEYCGNGNFERNLWWKRLWTVQELLLAKHPVVYFGPYTMAWARACKMWTFIDELEYSDMPIHGSSKMRKEIQYLDRLRADHARSLHALLLATADKGFTEPKDRIFALLGALPQDSLTLDYTLDIRVISVSAAVHCMTVQGNFDVLFSHWERSHRLRDDVASLHSCLPNFDHRRMGNMSQGSTCLQRLEQGRWESARIPTLPDLSGYDAPDTDRNGGIAVLTGRHISIRVIENLPTQCRIAFRGAFVTTIGKLYSLGQDDMKDIISDLSNATSRYFHWPPSANNAHWDVPDASQQEQHAYDLYTTLSESCLLHHGALAHDDRLLDMRFEAERQHERTWNPREILQSPKECLKFLDLIDECLRRPWETCLRCPLASNHPHWTANADSPIVSNIHVVLETLLSSVMKHKSWSGTFFITTDGHLGIGPKSTQTGDRVAIFDGARSPFILRTLENHDYALLGDSFVLGLMHGEVRDLDARGNFCFGDIVIQ
jgi:hypothetical protein